MEVTSDHQVQPWRRRGRKGGCGDTLTITEEAGRNCLTRHNYICHGLFEASCSYHCECRDNPSANLSLLLTKLCFLVTNHQSNWLQLTNGYVFLFIASYHIIMHKISASVSLNNEWQVGDAQPYTQDPTILRILLLRRRLIAYYLRSPPFSDEKHGLGLVGADSPLMWVRDHRLIMPNTLNPLAPKFSL